MIVGLVAEEKGLLHTLLPTERSFPQATPIPYLSPASPHVLSVGGGKGGVGKTLLATNLGISLTQLGFRVAIVDLDLGGANAHTCLGIDTEGLPSISDFFEQRMEHLTPILHPTPTPNLFVIAGASDMLSIANLAYTRKIKLIQKIRTLPMDYIILDLGAGTTFNTLDFFLTANTGLLTILPEPTSIENTYRFLKSVFHRILKKMSNEPEIGEFLNSISPKHRRELAPTAILELLGQKHPEKKKQIEYTIRKLNIKFILNQTRTQSDKDIGFGIKRVCNKYFGIQLDYLGYLEHDNSVWQAMRQRKPLSTSFPQQPITKKIQKIAYYFAKENHKDEKE